MLPTVLRLAAGIVCAGIALSLWDVGSRSPIEAVRDAVGAFGRPSRLPAGIVRAVAGLGYAALAIAFVMLALPDPEPTIVSAFIIGAFLTGLVFEALVGDALRRILGIGAAPTDGSPPER
jgi:hypothetical protein